MTQGNSLPTQQQNDRAKSPAKTKDTGSKLLLRPSQKVAALLILLGADCLLYTSPSPRDG